MPWLIAGIAFSLVVGGLIAYAAWNHYPAIFRAVDYQATVVETADAVTVCQNPAYPVSLRLPGAWHRARSLGEQYICTLAGPDGFFAAMWFIFPAMLPTLEANAAGIRQGMTRDDQFVFVSESALEINGAPARVLRFALPRDQNEMVMVIVKRGLVLYVFSVVGPGTVEGEGWAPVMGFLDESLQFQ